MGVSTMDGNYYVEVASQSGAMMKATNTKPMAVAIEADKLVFQTYHSGVITSSKCGTSLDHAVTVTGYVTSSSPNYWIVRNSWALPGVMPDTSTSACPPVTES